MKQFIFTLQPLYDMQEGLEKQIKLQLSALEAELTAHKKELNALNLRFEKTTAEYTGAVSRGVLAMRVRNYGIFFEKLRAVMLLQQGKIAKLEAEKADCLQRLVAVRKEKMLLDKLREEQHALYMEGVKKNQAKLMDDFVSYSTKTNAAQQDCD